MGVFSKSEEKPIKSGGFRLADQAFTDAKRYMDWQFFHLPQAPASIPTPTQGQ